MAHQDTANQADVTSRAATKKEKALEDRRELLKRLGRYGLYTAPALLVYFESAKAQGLSGN